MPRAGLTRDRLIEAAAVLADNDGFGALTLATLARQFDVRLASLYAHVDSLDDLRKALALRAFSLLAGTVEKAMAGCAGRDALIAFSNAHREFARTHPGLFDAMRMPLDAETAAASDGMRLSRLSRIALQGYDLTDADRVHATRLLGSVLLGFSLLEGSGSFAHSQPAPAFSWDQAMDGLHTLFAAWSNASPAQD